LKQKYHCFDVISILIRIVFYIVCWDVECLEKEILGLLQKYLAIVITSIVVYFYCRCHYTEWISLRKLKLLNFFSHPQVMVPN
jgi:hypothetical protein